MSFERRVLRAKFGCLYHFETSSFPGVTAAMGLNVTVALRFERDVFDVPDPDPAFKILRIGAPATSADFHGTEFFNVPGRSDLKRIGRWNLNDQVAIVDDLKSADDEDLTTAGTALVVHDTIGQAVRQLRKDFPELGNRIVLTSEIQGAPPKAAGSVQFILKQPTADIAGLGQWAYDTNTGETRWAGIKVGKAEDEQGIRRKRYEGFARLGLLDDVEAEIQIENAKTIIHEFGHVLGLRHNFRGYGVRDDGTSYCQSIMAYSQGLPSSLTGCQAGFGEHDILSLRFLYADLTSDPKATADSALEGLMKLPFETDRDGLFEQGFPHGEWVETFLAKSNDSRVKALREGDPEYWQKIQVFLGF